MAIAGDWIKPIKGRNRTLSGPIALVYAATAIFFSLWYLYTSGFGLVSTESNRGLYLMLTSVLVFLLYPALPTSPKTRPSLFDFLWVVAAVVSVGYWIDQYTDYAINRVSDPNRWDFVMGIIGIAVMLETSRRVLGLTVVIIAFVFLAQLYFGNYLPGKLAHSGLGVTRIVEFTFSTQEAMFGVVAATFATFVFPFMIFGAFLEASGAGQFFMELGTSLTGKWRGGPAKIAVVTSALFGSISGSSVANVVSTGSFTIPLMKRIGFKPHHAGAIEAISSTGGQFMPPIMGAGVFILATLTETEYLKIALMNVIPAFLFFFFLLYMVDIEAMKSGLKGLDEKEIPRVSTVLMRGWHYLIPLVVVLGLLFMGYSPDYGAFWGTVSAFVLSFRRKETMMGPRKVIERPDHRRAQQRLGGLGYRHARHHHRRHRVVRAGPEILRRADRVRRRRPIPHRRAGDHHLHHHRHGLQHHRLLHHPGGGGGAGADLARRAGNPGASRRVLCGLPVQHHAAGVRVGLCRRGDSRVRPDEDRLCRAQVRGHAGADPVQLRLCAGTAALWVGLRHRDRDARLPARLSGARHDGAECRAGARADCGLAARSICGGGIMPTVSDQHLDRSARTGLARRWLGAVDRGKAAAARSNQQMICDP